ncbi:arginine/lysine/ornithine decarboxylase [Gayadomonas joobiniege]|uniref:arginine/lysine/ornithine decarboxylase n=1 Tax=Gayadomonas joobiniege TaxID=1234606 RepID=UPI0003708A80|nr:arginine/lysine/ornithine decarboxylase [Gayadomonas joobiniege]
MKFKFPVVIIDEDFRSENISGSGIRDLADAISALDFEILGLTSFGDLRSFAPQASRACCFVLSIDDDEFADGKQDAIAQIDEFIRAIRQRNADIPIFLYGETQTAQQIPLSLLRELHGFIHMFEDTPEFVARYIVREAQKYLNALAPPFFKALMHYAEDSSYSWHCPGHSGGVAFLKSPVGQMFHQFFGENMLRADVCNSVDELGQLLDHTGPVAESELNAARIFSCDHLFFVTNGTSTSNKIVWHANVSPGDVVVVDRNCHKSVLHSIIMTGAIPVFLRPSRNHYGIIGPIPRHAFTAEHINQLIEANPFARAAKVKKPKILTLTQSTYDGVIYNVETIKQQLTGVIDTLHFDEAWLPHASFHEFYQKMYAMEGDANQPSVAAPLVFSTQSTHKLLAGLSQASQILVKDGSQHKLDRHRFNESYLMHSSTSPQYSIIASCDVAAAMMEAPGGRALVAESLTEALDFRRAMRKVDADLGEDDWWFQVWGPETLCPSGIGEQADWVIRQDEQWHGFEQVETGFNMLDPIKATLMTPGLNIQGDFAATGIPAAIVSKYLAEHGIIIEKTGLYSFFIMFTIGITKGRWNSMVTELQQFKDDYDHNLPIYRVMPEFAAKHPEYAAIGLQDLCQSIHQMYRDYDVARVTTDMYLSEVEMAMIPSQAWAKMTDKAVERVSVDEIEGRITAMLVTPYPPGIPLMVPGERFNTTVVKYLKFVRDFNARFAGFETYVHGLIAETDGGKTEYFVDVVME